MASSTQYELARVTIFANVPQRMHSSISDEVLADVQAQVVSQYEIQIEMLNVGLPKLQILNVESHRGCVEVEITLGFGGVGAAALMLILGNYSTWRENIIAAAKDVKTVSYCVAGIEQREEKTTFVSGSKFRREEEIVRDIQNFLESEASGEGDADESDF